MEIVVYQPEIAGNVGAIIRLSANSGIPVNFIKPFGFNMQENKIPVSYTHLTLPTKA